MELVPEVFLDFWHIAPSVHSVSFNISYFFLVVILLLLVSLGILFQVNFLWAFDNDLGYFLWSLYFFDFYILFEPLLYDF